MIGPYRVALLFRRHVAGVSGRPVAMGGSPWTVLS